MKKLLAAIALGMMAVGGNVASAAVAEEQLAVGGAVYGATIAEVEAACGQPARQEREQKYYGEKLEYDYANGLSVSFVDGVVEEISLDRPGSLKTADGVGIGATAAELIAAYGEPDAVYGDEYVYYLAGSRSEGLSFDMEHGKVKEIECGHLD